MQLTVIVIWWLIMGAFLFNCIGRPFKACLWCIGIRYSILLIGICACYALVPK